MEQVPESFKLVDFDNPDTWPNAPMHEWLEMRRQIADKRQGQVEGETYDRYLAVLDESMRQVHKEAAARNRGVGPPMSGRQRRRLNELLMAGLKKQKISMPFLTRWEIEFSRKTSWLDRIEDAYDEDSEDATIIRALFAWISQSDNQLQSFMSDARSRSRANTSRSSGVKLAHGKNALLPNPIELLQVLRLIHLFVSHIRSRIEIAEQSRLRSDKYGCAFACPKCKEKHDDLRASEHCCGVRHTISARALLGRAMPLYGKSHEAAVLKLLKLLWSFGYATGPTPKATVDWKDWGDLLDTGVGEFSQKFIGHLFNAEARTIARHLTRKNLSKEYDLYGFAEEHRDFQHRNRIGSPATISVKGRYKIGPSAALANPHGIARRIVFKWS